VTNIRNVAPAARPARIARTASAVTLGRRPRRVPSARARARPAMNPLADYRPLELGKHATRAYFQYRRIISVSTIRHDVVSGRFSASLML
jgi:hypothetical protein